ncbi:MAG: response regulator transcription factor [Acidimicrobiales bacterium]|jgi:DNA-binding NarL/FixJ family response regulator|nr:response regulator transcription factor [Acidimicrobiales bacterium]
MNDRPIRVMVVDDHALIREGARALIGTLPGLEHVGDASTGGDAVALAATLEPDVVLMDLGLPDLDGVAATAAITTTNPRIAVLVVSMLDDDASVFAAMRAGARGYVLKGAEPGELDHAIRSVARGDAIFGAGIAERVLSLLTDEARPAAAAPFSELTDRELQVLDHLASGATNPQIAGALHLSPRTVANHVSNILNKLHATDRTDAALRARDAGLGQRTSPST